MVDNDIPYKAGTIKLTWIDPRDYSILNGQMFDSLDQALDSAKTRNLGENWLVFQLRQTDGNRYEWDLLPYGKHKGYIQGMKLRDNPVLKFAVIALMAYGAYSLIKTLFVKKTINAGQ
jgi:hypothetical protein